GMMVDNSIVVLESCFRIKEQQMDTKEAAIEGTRVVTSSIIASTLTTVVVFLPIALMEGMTGQLFAQLGYTIVFSLTASLFTALTLVPLVFYRIEPKEKSGIWMSRLLHRTGEGYGRFLQKTFRHKKLVVLVAVLLLVVSIVALSTIPMELMPAIDQGMITIRTQNRPGLNIKRVDEIAKSLEKMVSETPDVDNYSVYGDGSGVSINVYLKGDRAKSTLEIVDEWRNMTRDTVDYTVSVSSFNMADAMSGGGSVQINLQGNDRDSLKEASQQVVNMMRESPSIIKATSTLTDGNPQAEIVVDPIKANAAGLMPAQIISAVNSTMHGKNAASLHQNGHQYDIWVEYPSDTYDEISDLSGFTLTNPMGMQVPLLDVATIKYSNAPQAVSKMNNQYLVTITGEPTTAAKLTASSEMLAAVGKMKLPDGVTFQGGFSNEAMMEEFSAIGNAILAAVFLVFMVMAMQFESVKFSLVV
ncbi:MAG: efflux RND transporter permease subunit, partial [Angelakisella sp.]